MIHPGDPVADDWAVVVLGAHFAAALVARDVTEEGSTLPPQHEDRCWEWALTFDRDLVIRCARALVSRIAPAESLPSAGDPAGLV